MEGANADNVRPPAAKARSQSRAQTAHSQAPTMTSVRVETNRFDSTSSGAKSDQEGGDPPPEPPKTWPSGKEGQFLPKPLPPPRTSQTPAREIPTQQTPAREPTHPLQTDGLDQIVIEDSKKRDKPKGRDKLKDPETDRRP